MAKPKRTQARSVKKRQPKTKPPVVKGQTGSPPGPALYPGLSQGMDEGTLQTQADRLGDPRLKSAQKQALAAQIGWVQGNKHLQRVMDRLNTAAADGASRSDVAPTLPRWESDQTQNARQPGFGRIDAINSNSGQAQWMTRPSPVQRQKGGNGSGTSKTVDTKSGAGVKDGAVPNIKFGRVKFTPKEIPADGKTTSQASVKVTPGGRAVKWGFVGSDYGSTISGTGVVTPGKDLKGDEKVQLTVKAMDELAPTAFTTGLLTVWDAKYFEAKKDYPKFIAGTYQKQNFTIGKNGKFDVKYQPAGKLLDIQVKVRFEFLNDKSGGFDKFMHSMLGLFSEEAADNYAAANGMWTTKAMNSYRKTFMSQVTTAWNKDYKFENVREPKKIWSKLGPVGVKLNVVELPETATNQHFTIKVHKKAGGAQVAGGVTDLYPGDDKTQSPFFQKGATQGELKRLAKINPGPILFANNSTAVDPKYEGDLSFMKTYLSRINQPKFDITITGHANTVGNKTTAGKSHNQDLSEKRAEAVADTLRGSGHNIKTTGVGTTGASDDPLWRKADITPAIQAGFVNKFDTIPHEFGHMIGLGDEYKRPGAAKLTTHHPLVVKAFGKKYADLVASRGAAPTTQGTSSSITNVGQDVRIYHYVTFWAALCETTLKAPVPDPKFGYSDWKFVE